ncbi:hypothetical protein ACTXT7_014150 [Hymenolepis weldensis]
MGGEGDNNRNRWSEKVGVLSKIIDIAIVHTSTRTSIRIRNLRRHHKIDHIHLDMNSLWFGKILWDFWERHN